MVIKNLINRNQLKKLMQVGIDVTCMHTIFGGRGLSGFGDIAPFFSFKNSQNFPLIVHGGQKIESAQKIHASRG